MEFPARPETPAALQGTSALWASKRIARRRRGVLAWQMEGKRPADQPTLSRGHLRKPDVLMPPPLARNSMRCCCGCYPLDSERTLITRTMATRPTCTLQDLSTTRL